MDIFKEYIKGILFKMGYVISHRDYVPHMVLPYLVGQILVNLKINCVLDVGANKGQYRDFLRRVLNYKGLIVSFEPTQKNYKILFDRARNDRNWVVLPYALGNENGQKMMNIMKADTFSSFLKPDDSTENFQNNVVEFEERVDIRRLDDVIAELGDDIGSRNIYLKMDTQGYDLEVVKGGAACMQKILALQSEICVLPIYERMPDSHTSIRTLMEAGFDISGMVPVVSRAGRVIEFDCVMISRRAALGRADDAAWGS